MQLHWIRSAFNIAQRIDIWLQPMASFALTKEIIRTYSQDVGVMHAMQVVLLQLQLHVLGHVRLNVCTKRRGSHCCICAASCATKITEQMHVSLFPRRMILHENELVSPCQYCM